MAFNEDEILAPLNEASYIDQLNRIQAEVNYELLPLTSSSLLVKALGRIPLFKKFLSDLETSGQALFRVGDRVTKLPDLRKTPGMSTAGEVFQFGSIVLSGLDFIRIPLIYLGAYLLNEKVPVSLNKNARFFYSALLLALAITPFIFPFTGPILTLVGAGIGLTVSIFLLGKTLYDRYQLGKEKKEITHFLEREEGEMRLIQQEAKRLLDNLSLATEAQKSDIFQKTNELEEKYQKQKIKIQNLKNHELHLNQRIKKLGTVKVLDKSVGVALGSLTLIGFVVSLFFPPVGLWLLIGASIAVGVYFLGRIAAPLFELLGHWVISNWNPSSDDSEVAGGLVKDMSLSNDEKKELDAQSPLFDKNEANENMLSEASITEHSYHSTLGILVGLGAMENKVVIDVLKPELPEQDEKSIAAKSFPPLFTSKNSSLLKEEYPVSSERPEKE